MFNECIALIASAEDHGQVDQGTLADLSPFWGTQDWYKIKRSST
jgi:hypothetical protein